MNQVSENVKAFFENFDHANNAFEADLLAPLVSDPVVGADPNGGVGVIKKDDYLAGTAERKAFLSALGFQSVNVVPVEETPLGNDYVLVKVHGTMRLEKIPGQPIDLVHNAAYILYVKDGSSRIVFTLTHEDPMKMAQERGLLPTNR